MLLKQNNNGQYDFKLYVPLAKNTSPITTQAYVLQAETVLQQYIGSALYHVLNNAYNATGICMATEITNKWTRCALECSQKFVAYYAYAQMIKGQSLMVSDMGVQQYSGDAGTNTPATMQDKQANHYLWLDMAWQALEELIWSCLYPEACHYRAWLSSEQYCIAIGSVVYSPAILRRYYKLPDVGAFPVWHLLFPTFKTVERDVIEPLLCHEQYCAIKTDIEKGTPNSCEYGKLLGMVQEAVATIAVEQLLGRMIQLTPHGLRIVTRQEPYTANAAANDYQTQHHYLSTNQARNRAIERIRTELSNNLDKYPLFKASACFCKQFPEHEDCKKPTDDCLCEEQRTQNRYGIVTAKHGLGL